MGTPLDTETSDRPYVREGRIFKAYRIMAGFTQRNLGKDLGIPLSMIREYEQGRCLPGPDRLLLIMFKLDIPVSDLISPSAVADDEPCSGVAS